MIDDDKLITLTEQEFKRLVGIQKNTFQKIIQILTQAEQHKKRLGGKPNLLTLSQRLFMSLQYWREYRTYFHIAQSYNISESACYKNIKWIEDVLSDSSEFALEGSKYLEKIKIIENRTINATTS